MKLPNAFFSLLLLVASPLGVTTVDHLLAGRLGPTYFIWHKLFMLDALPKGCGWGATQGSVSCLRTLRYVNRKRRVEIKPPNLRSIDDPLYLLNHSRWLLALTKAHRDWMWIYKIVAWWTNLLQCRQKARAPSLVCADQQGWRGKLCEAPEIKR